jgi:hypothetical protein
MANKQYFICVANFQGVDNEKDEHVKTNFNFGLVRQARPTTQELVEIVQEKFRSAVNIRVIAGEVTKADYNAYYNHK